MRFGFRDCLSCGGVGVLLGVLRCRGLHCRRTSWKLKIFLSEKRSIGNPNANLLIILNPVCNCLVFTQDIGLWGLGNSWDLGSRVSRLISIVGWVWRVWALGQRTVLRAPLLGLSTRLVWCFRAKATGSPTLNPRKP